MMLKGLPLLTELPPVFRVLGKKLCSDKNTLVQFTAHPVSFFSSPLIP